MTQDDSQWPLTRRQALVGGAAATGGFAGLVEALGSEAGNLYGGTMALSQAYKVAEAWWQGPDSAKANIKAKSGRRYSAVDTGIEYYGDSGAWRKFGYGSSAEPGAPIHSEQLNSIKLVSPSGSTEIQAAIDDLAVSTAGGGAVVLDSGDYWFSDTVNVPQKCWVLGQGLSTELLPSDGLNKDLFKVTGDYAYISNVLLRGRSSKNSSGNGIAFEGELYNAGLINVAIENFADSGVYVYNNTGDAFELHFRNVQSHQNGRHGFELLASGDLHAAHCYAEKNAMDGFYDSAGFSTYMNAHGYDNRNGFHVPSGTRRIQLTSSHFETNKRRGVYIKGKQVFITDPVMYANSQESAGTYAAVEIEDSTSGSPYAIDTKIRGGVIADPGGNTQDAAVREIGNADNTHVNDVVAFSHVTTDFDLIGDVSTLNQTGTEDLGTSPTSAPSGNFYNGTIVRNSNSDNNETWVKLRGTWVQIA